MFSCLFALKHQTQIHKTLYLFPVLTFQMQYFLLQLCGCVALKEKEKKIWCYFLLLPYLNKYCNVIANVLSCTVLYYLSGEKSNNAP